MTAPEMAMTLMLTTYLFQDVNTSYPHLQSFGGSFLVVLDSVIALHALAALHAFLASQ